VRGVADELLLRAGGRLQRGQHRVEAGREPAELIGSVRLDALGEVSGLRHVLGRARQTADRRERGARDREAESRCQCDPDRGDDEQVVADARERVVDLGERPRDLDGEALRVRDRDHPHVHAGDVGVREEAVPLPVRHRAHVVVHRELDLLVRKPDRVPGRAHDLEIARCPAELGARPQKCLIPRLEGA